MCTTVLGLLILAAAALGWEYRIAGGGSRGRLEVRPSSSYSWGTVCDDYFTSDDAIVACRSLGLGTDGATSYTAGSGSGTIYMDDVNCRGTESELSSCTYTANHNCAHSEDVGVQCGSGSSSGTSSWEYRIAGGSNRGRLEVRPSSTSSWGTVCDDSFSSSDARVACRSLGYDSPSTVEYYTAGGGGGTIYMDDMTCSGSEATLADCDYTSSHNCAHSEDVGVQCGTYVPWYTIAIPVAAGALCLITIVVCCVRRCRAKPPATAASTFALSHAPVVETAPPPRWNDDGPSPPPSFYPPPSSDPPPSYPPPSYPPPPSSDPPPYPPSFYPAPGGSVSAGSGCIYGIPVTPPPYGAPPTHPSPYAAGTTHPYAVDPL